MPRLSPLRWLCFVLLVVSSIVASAQSFTFKEYGQDQGLGDLAIRSIAQDHDGYLWIATEHGLFRYDGSHFVDYGKKHGLASTMVVAIHVDKRGVLWAGTSGGLFFMDKDQFHRVTAANKELTFDDNSSIVSTPSGEVVVNSERELYSVEPASGSVSAMPYHVQHGQVPAGMIINGVYASEDGGVWLGCDETICHVSGTGFQRLGPSDGIPADRYVALKEDRAGNLWARGDKEILQRQAGSSQFLDVSQGFPFDARDPSNSSLSEDPKGRIMTPAAHGLARWNGKSWDRVDPSGGMPDSNITQLFVDSEGLVWIGTRGRGLFKWLGYGDWEDWSTAQGIRNPAVFAIARDRTDRVWVGNGSTIDVSDEQHHQFRPFARKLPPNLFALQSAASDVDGTLWFGDFTGVLLHIHPETGTYETITVPRGIHQTFADSSGTLWVLTHKGLYTVAPASAPGGQRSPVLDADPVISGRKLKAIAEGPDKTLWLGTDDGLFHRVDGKWHKVQLHNPDIGTSIASVAAGPNGEVWVAGDFGGVARLRVKDNVVGLTQIFTIPTLSSESVNGILVDSRGWVWIAGDHGVDILQSGRWRRFDRDEGLLWNDTNEGALVIDPDGSAWIGTSAGLSHLIHSEPPAGAHPLTARIENATWGGHALSLDKPSKLPWQSGDLDVDFAVFSYRNENAISFRYRLVGLEEDWSTTREHSVRYPKLPAGHYRLEVVAEDSGVHRVSKPAVLVFEIKPPWWMTPTAWLFAGIAILALGALFMRWRLMRLIAMQKRLEKQVAERTHALQTERRELLATREVLRQQATRDGLTGLLNRVAILEVLDREWKRAEREKMGLAVIIADVDHFKQFNDTFGHIAGDEVLRAIAVRLKEGVREYDSVGRYGGEEFLIVLMGWQREGGEERLTYLWQSVCGNPLRIGNRMLRSTSSFGVAGFSAGEAAIPVNDLLIRADKALYRAKVRGRNRIEFAGHEEGADQSGKEHVSASTPPE